MRAAFDAGTLALARHCLSGGRLAAARLDRQQVASFELAWAGGAELLAGETALDAAADGSTALEVALALLFAADAAASVLDRLEVWISKPASRWRCCASCAAAPDGTRRAPPVPAPGIPLTFVGMERAPPAPAPLPGQHTEQVLTDLLGCPAASAAACATAASCAPRRPADPIRRCAGWRVVGSQRQPTRRSQPSRKRLAAVRDMTGVRAAVRTCRRQPVKDVPGLPICLQQQPPGRSRLQEQPRPPDAQHPSHPAACRYLGSLTLMTDESGKRP